MPRFGLAADEVLEALGYLFLRHAFEPVAGNRGDRGIDATDGIRPACRRVLVGRFVRPFDGELDRRLPVDVVLPTELDGRAGVASAGAGRVEVGLFVTATGDVVLVDAAHTPAQVVASEDRDDDEALHRRRQ